MNSAQHKHDVFVFTGPLPAGHKVTTCYGIVGGQACMGANMVKDFFAGLTDSLGGRARGYESVMASAMEVAVSTLCENAKQLGANAVIHTSVDVDSAGGGKMFMASAVGTAVRIVPEN